MANLVIYDSQYGNTEKIALRIAQAIHTAKAVKAAEADLNEIKESKLLIVGSPTWGGRPTAAIQKFLNTIPERYFEKVKVAAFDTRVSEKDQNFALKLLLKTIGYAAPKIINGLIKKGGVKVLEPVGFIVKGKEGPLADGEIERAELWAKQILSKI